jgi:hypothetical protein
MTRLAEETANEFLSRNVQIVGNIAENLAKCADGDLAMHWNSYVMLVTSHG